MIFIITSGDIGQTVQTLVRHDLYHFASLKLERFLQDDKEKATQDDRRFGGYDDRSGFSK
jgi:hypothetical protein